MKSLRSNTLSAALPLTAVLAVVALLSPAARAQYSSNGANNPGNPGNAGDPNQGQPTPYVTVPGMAQPVPSAYESIGMRQARFQTPPAQTVWLAQPGLSPTGFELATALDTLARTGQPENVLAANSVVLSLNAAPLNGVELRILQMRIQASENAMDVLQARTVQFGGDTQAQYRDALRDVQDRRSQLERSLQTAAQAAPNTTGDTEARAALASDYQSYTEAVARAQRLATM